MKSRRYDYNDLAIDNIIDANVKLVDRNKDLEKENKELKEKINFIKELLNQPEYYIPDELKNKIISIIEGEEYEENKDIFSFI